MTPEQKAFHNAFLNRGGLFNPSQLGNFARIFANTKADMYQKVTAFQATNKRAPSVIFDFINNEKINAVATKKNGCYFIGINWATVFLLWDLFMRMMTSPKVYSQVGNASGETIKEYIAHIIPRPQL